MKRNITQVKASIKRIKDYELASIIAIVHSILSYFYSNAFFEYNPEDTTTKNIKLLVNILLPVVLFFVYWGAIKILRTNKYHQYLKRSICYFILLMILLILVWPGIWRHDDMYIAICAKKYIVVDWQHVLTSLFYMLSFKLLPFFSGVIIIQCLVISIITSYIYTQLLEKLNQHDSLTKIILWVPFLLPPVLDSALYPLRPILYSYLLILLIYLMIKTLKNIQCSWQNLVSLSLLFVVSSTWRSEGIFLFIVALVYFFYLLKKHKAYPYQIFLSLIIICGGILSVRSFQNSFSTTHTQNRYQLSSTIELLTPLVRTAANDMESNKELLDDINKVIDVNLIINNPEKRGEYIFWINGAVHDDYTEEDYKNYMKSFIKLALKYPQIAAKNRIQEFLATSALIPNQTNTIKDSTSFYEYAKDPGDETAKTFINDGGFSVQPISKKIRTSVIRLIEGRTLEDYHKTTPLYPIFWNLVIPLLGVLLSIVLLLKHKHIATALIIATILIKTCIVFITAPQQFHMYYYAEYLLGYILISYILSYAIVQYRIKHKKNMEANL